MAHRSSCVVAMLATGVVGISCLLTACGGAEDSVSSWVDGGTFDYGSPWVYSDASAPWVYADAHVQDADASSDAGLVVGIDWDDASTNDDAGWWDADVEADAGTFDDAAPTADAGEPEPDAGDPASTCPAGTAHPNVCCQLVQGALSCGEWVSGAEGSCPSGYTSYVDLATCCAGNECTATP